VQVVQAGDERRRWPERWAVVAAGEGHRPARRPGRRSFLHGIIVAKRSYGPVIRVLHVTDGELDALLASPRADDELREPVTIVVGRDGGRVSQAALDRLTVTPCVVIGVGHDATAPPPHVDLVVEDDVCALDDVVATVDAHPLASTTLTVLLRSGPHRSLEAGLAAESAAYSTLQGGPELAAWRAAHPIRARERAANAPVRTERDGARLTVVLDRPHVRNALDRAMRDALLEAFALVAADATIAEVVVRGEGPSFCSGGDLDEFATFDDPASAHLVRLSASLGRAIAAVADRVTCLVHGPCAGSGVELPAFAGRVVAAPDTTLALPEVSLGLVPGAGGTVSLTRRAGRHRVALLALSGRAIDATTALRWGLVDAVQPLDALPAF